MASEEKNEIDIDQDNSEDTKSKSIENEKFKEGDKEKTEESKKPKEEKDISEDDKIKKKLADIKKDEKEQKKLELKEKEETLKKERLEKRKDLLDKKKKEVKDKKEKKKYKKLLKLPEPKQQIIRAAGGGLLGVLTQVAITYILWGIATDNSILYLGFMIDVSSMGNPLNSLACVWALAFTPFTALPIIVPNWLEIWYYIFIPTIVAGVVVGVTAKRLLSGILGGLFFIFWGIVIPLSIVIVFSVFGFFDTALIDAILYPIINEPMSVWNYAVIFNITNNYFLSWTVAGTLESSLIVVGIGVLISTLIQIIK